MEPRATAARELLLGVLEDLSQEQLKRFRHKLRDERVDGRSIPWGRLEGADTLDLVKLLVHFYGPERALDVAQKTLKRADVRDVAAQLKERRLQSECQVGLRLGPPSASPAWAGSWPRASLLWLPRKSARPPRGPTPDAPFRTPPSPRDPAQLSLPGLGPSSPALLSVSGRSLSAGSAGSELSGHFGCPQSHSEVPHSWPWGGAQRGGCEAIGETEAGAPPGRATGPRAALT